MRKAISVVLIVVFAFCLFACAETNNATENKESSKEIVLNIQNAAEKIKGSVKFNDELTHMDGSMARDMYGFNSKNVDAYAGSGASAEMIVVAEYDSEEKAENGINFMNNFVKEQIDIFSSYSPTAVKALENKYICRFGRYVVFVISPDENVANKVPEAIK